MNDLAIKTENLGKYYKLGQFNSGSLAKDIQSWMAVKRGKEDPNSIIGKSSTYDQDGFWALRGINLEIHKGDRVGIIGRNGAGKSTLLKVLSQVTSPTEGRIGINGRIASLLEVGTGFHPEMTGRENVYMNGAILGMKRSEINAKMKDIIEFSEIEKHIDTPVKRYSSGMYVRLAFAVAANLESDILIADEVLAVGDATFQKKALGKMGELSSGQGRTVLFVSHQMNAVRTLCDKGIMLEHGQQVFEGGVKECIEYYQKDLFGKQREYELSRFDNEFFNLLDFDIVDKSGLSVEGSLSNDEEYYVKIVYEMKKLHSGFCLGYSIYDKEGNVIYWSYPNDDIKRYEGPIIGENTVLGRIPSHFLNEDDYYVYIQGGIHYQEWLINPEIEAPRIQISIRGGLSESPFWTIRRPGVCAPIIDWKVIKKNV